MINLYTTNNKIFTTNNKIFTSANMKTPALVAHYLFNDDTPNYVVTDQIGTNAQSVNATTDNLSTVGKINDCFDLTASNSEYVNCNQTFGQTFNKPFNMSFWLKPNDGQPATTQIICGGKFSSGNYSYFEIDLNASTGVIYVAYLVYDGSTQHYNNASKTVFADGATSWTHFCVNVSSTGIDMYTNNDNTGVTSSSNTVDMSLFDDTSLSNFGIGNRLSSTGPIAGYYFDGMIDDWRVYDNILPLNIISTIWNNGNGTES